MEINKLWEQFHEVRQNAFSALVNVFKTNNFKTFDIDAIIRKLSEMAKNSEKKLSDYYGRLIDDLRSMQESYSFDVFYSDTYRESFIRSITYDPSRFGERQIAIATESFGGDFNIERANIIHEVHYYLFALNLLDDVLRLVDLTDGNITPKAPYYFEIYENNEVIYQSEFYSTKDEVLSIILNFAFGFISQTSLTKHRDCVLEVSEEQECVKIVTPINEVCRIYRIKKYIND